MKSIYGSIILFLTSAILHSGNLLPDASFELGGADYGKVRFFDGVRLEDCTNVPPVEDEKEFVHGKRSLRFDTAGNVAASSLRTPEFRLDSSKDYTLSFYAKSNGRTKVNLMLLSIEKHPDGRIKRSWDNINRKVFTFSDQWKRYSFTFRPQISHHKYYLADFAWKNEKNVSVWFDAIQLEEGKNMTMFVPKADLEFAFQGIKHLRIGTEKPLECRLIGVNYTKKPLSAKLHLAEREYYFDEPFPGKTLEFTIPAEDRAERRIETRGTRNGVYELTARFGKSETWPFYYAVAGKYIPGKFNADRDFALGAEESISCNYADLNGGKPYFQLMEGESFADYLVVKRNEGQRLLRIGNGRRFFEWKAIEKTPGKFDFTETDVFFESIRKTDADFLGVPGILGLPEHMPEWVVARAKKTGKTRLNNRQAALPDMKDFRNYVSALVSHFKGKIRFWEIFNEPNLIMDADQYVPYMKAAYEEIRKIDPSIRVVGPCSTGDLGGQMGEFLEEFGRLGGFKYCDVVSFHPYSSPAEDSPYPARKAIRDIREILKKYHCSAPLWNTELYYLPTWKKNGPRDGVDVSRGQAHHLATRLLIDLSEGVKQSTLLPDAFSFRQDRHPNYDYFGKRVTHKRIPSDIYVAGNAFARIFEGAIPVEMLPAPQKVSIGTFQLKNAKSAAAMWNFSETQKIQISCMESKKFTCLDLFGNPVEWKNPMKLTKNPLYLISDLSPAELGNVLKKAEIQRTNASEITFARYGVAPDGTPSLALTILNHTEKELNARVRPLTNEFFRPAKTGSFKIQVPPSGTATIQIPIILQNSLAEGPAANAEVLIQDSGAARKVKIKLESSKFLSYGKTVLLKGKAEFEVSFRADADRENFLLQATVRDPIRSERRDSPWKDDCVELFFDRNPFELPERKEYTKDVFRLFLRPASADGKAADIQIMGAFRQSDARWNFREIPDGYELKLAIPWKALNSTPDGSVFFDLAVDNAGKDESEQLVWSSGKYVYLYRHRFGIVR